MRSLMNTYDTKPEHLPCIYFAEVLACLFPLPLRRSLLDDLLSYRDCIVAGMLVAKGVVAEGVFEKVEISFILLL